MPGYVRELTPDADAKRATPLRRWGFAFLLLLSGFCGISYEVLYARILSNAIGDQFAVNASILVTFMIGIGFGTLYAHRLWRWLWAIEAAVGICGVAFALGSGKIESLYYATASFGGGLRGAMVFCFVLLIGPAFLIGCSLPLFAGYLGRMVSRAVFARAYMIYNFGAALTVVVIEFWLFRRLGLRDTVLVMAALNGVVAVLLYFGFGGVRAEPEQPSERVALPVHPLLALVMASVASAVFQLLMIKVAECFLGPFRETFALVLAIVLFGIATGSALLRRFPLSIGWVMGLALVGLAWLVGGFEWVARGYAALKPAAVQHGLTNVLLRVGALALLMGLPVVAFGATIPSLLRTWSSMARDSGRLLFISSLANALGFLLMAFVLHRSLDYGTLIVFVAALAAASLVVAYRGSLRAVIAGVTMLAVIVLLHRVRWDEDLLYLSYDAYQSSDDFKWYRAELGAVDRFKGNQDVFALSRIGDSVHFFINGYVSIALESAAERLVGSFPALFAPRTDRALVLGVGSGITTGTVALLFDHVDAVEINPVVLQNLHRMSAYNFDLPSRTNATLFVDDAIHYVRVHPEQYSLIISTVTSPRYFSSAKLYTQDFFDAVRQRLTPDGVYVTWVDMMVGQRGLDIMLKTASRSFRHCALGGVNTGYFLLLCSDEPIRLRRPDAAAENELLAGYLAKNNLRPEWLAYGLLTTNASEAIVDDSVPINTREYPALEFQAALLDARDSHDFADRLIANLSLDDLAGALRPALTPDPMDLLLYSEALFKESDITDRWRELASRGIDDFPSRYDTAKLEYAAWQARVTDSAESHHLYGAALLTAGRYEDAFPELAAALSREPLHDDAHLDAGLALEKLARWPEALAEFKAEVAVDPGDLDAEFGIARAAFELKRYDQALQHLTLARDEENAGEVDAYLARVREALQKAP